MHPSNPVYADIFPLKCLEKCIFVHISVLRLYLKILNICLKPSSSIFRDQTKHWKYIVQHKSSA